MSRMPIVAWSPTASPTTTIIAPSTTPSENPKAVRQNPALPASPKLLRCRRYSQRLGERSFGTGHVGQRRVEDDHVEGLLLERQDTSVGFSEGDVGQICGEVAGPAE